MTSGRSLDTMREERRVVTALFADIVGSTSIGERLDPEDARDILGGAVRLIIEQVDAMGGTVKDLAGDGVLALFGAPVAHEDDAERAVLTGLRAVEAIADHASDVAERWGVEGISIRVGIETGRAVLGPVGGGSHVEYGATGDALNTAARIQAEAEPGTVLVGEATRRMVEDRFSWGDRRRLLLKGKELPIDASRALAYAPRPHVAAGIVGGPLVGRTEEVSILNGALSDLRAGRGAIVTIVGEAGVGKSRLVTETRGRFAAFVGGTWLEATCMSYAASIPYQPYRHALLAWLRLPLEARREEVRSSLRAAAAALPQATVEALEEIEPMLASAEPDVGGDPEALQSRLFDAVRTFLGGLSAESPVVLALEDLHWADPTSLALTQHLASLVADRPVLIVLTMRPEPSARSLGDRVGERFRSSSIELEPLSRDGDRELLHALVGATTLPHALEERLLDTTDGNPFFVEEQVRALVDAGVLRREDGGWQLSGAPEVSLAPTAERALLARIDRLEETQRQTLLAASVLGQRFDEHLLRALAPTELGPVLEELEDGGFLIRTEASEGASLAFRHALVQEAAYGSLVKRQRHELHARAAVALAAAYEGREDEIAETLGYHLAEADDRERAVIHMRTAALRAASAYSNDEAAAITGRALDLLGDVGAIDPSQRELAAELLATRATVLGRLARYEEAVAASRGALDLLPRGDDVDRARARLRTAQLLKDLHRYDDALAELEAAQADIADPAGGDDRFAAWLEVQLARANVFYWRVEDLDRYAELLAEVEPLIRQRATPRQRAEFYGSLWGLLMRRSRYVVDDEILRLERAAYAVDAASDDPGDRAWAAFTRAFTLLWHGDMGEARRLLEQTLGEGERLGDALLRARSLTYLLVVARFHGDVARATTLVPAVLEAARDGRLPEYEAFALAGSAWAARRRGDLPAASADGRRALAIFEATPNRYVFDWMAAFPLLAIALDEGETREATRLAGRMLDPAQQPLPAPLDDLLAAGVEAIEDHRDAEGIASLARAVEEAERTGHA